MYLGGGNPQTPRQKKIWWIGFILFLAFIVLTLVSPYLAPHFAYDFRW